MLDMNNTTIFICSFAAFVLAPMHYYTELYGIVVLIALRSSQQKLDVKWRITLCLQGRMISLPDNETK